MINRIERTLEKRGAFLQALAECGNVREACNIVRVSPNTMYLWRNEDEKFREEWLAASVSGSESLEDEAMRRARDGWDEPVWHQGEQVGTVRKYSDTLLIFLLKGQMREKYGDQSRVDLNAKVDYADKSDAELDEKLRLHGVDVAG